MYRSETDATNSQQHRWYLAHHYKLAVSVQYIWLSRIGVEWMYFPLQRLCRSNRLIAIEPDYYREKSVGASIDWATTNSQQRCWFLAHHYKSAICCPYIWLSRIGVEWMYFPLQRLCRSNRLIAIEPDYYREKSVGASIDWATTNSQQRCWFLAHHYKSAICCPYIWLSRIGVEWMYFPLQRLWR